jgi:hypothetical protein
MTEPPGVLASSASNWANAPWLMAPNGPQAFEHETELPFAHEDAIGVLLAALVVVRSLNVRIGAVRHWPCVHAGEGIGGADVGVRAKVGVNGNRGVPNDATGIAAPCPALTVAVRRATRVGGGCVAADRALRIAGAARLRQSGGAVHAGVGAAGEIARRIAPGGHGRSRDTATARPSPNLPQGPVRPSFADPVPGSAPSFCARNGAAGVPHRAAP